MDEIFKLADIKAGYLLCVEDWRDGHKFNMTVIPAKSGNNGLADLVVTSVTGVRPPKPGDLACANREENWCPLTYFDNQLVGVGWRVNAVYGYAPVSRAMANTIDGRDLLWRRYLPKPMTRAEIEKALGHKVKIVEPGAVVEEPVIFKKSSITAGMVVKLRNGTHRLAVPTEQGMALVHFCTGSNEVVACNALTDYTPDLRGVRHVDLDVIEVWSRVLTDLHMNDAFTTDRTHRHRLWERDEAKRMTMQDIEKALGYPVVLLDDRR